MPRNTYLLGTSRPPVNVSAPVLGSTAGGCAKAAPVVKPSATALASANRAPRSNTRILDSVIIYHLDEMEMWRNALIGPLRTEERRPQILPNLRPLKT